jgi:3-isopropylmalate/(R)-2-methylmalate dehydratase small subunit
MSLIREGRVWRFGDGINTDLIFPSAAFRAPQAEQHRLVFAALRPGWVDQVRPGDLLVAGRNFGVGSARPVGAVLKACGIAGVLAESINGICLRNCINESLPALNCPGITDLLAEGERARVDFVAGLVLNLTTGRSMTVPGLPPLFVDIIAAGGVVPMLIQEGYIEAAAPGSD